jgi:glycerol-3-phosphate dehydrogenase (NAD(P)+)
VIAVLGVGAMGVALASHLARAGNNTVVLATEYDHPAVQAWRRGAPHPALGVVLDRDIAIIEPVGWEFALADADIVAVAVASQGLQPVLSTAARYVSPHAVWMLATKGWQTETLRAPSEVAAAILGPAASVVTLAGPGIAAEIVAGSPTALLCASRDADARRRVAQALTAPSMLVVTTSDVAGAETASGYKNVAAIAVGIAEGLSQRFIESAFVRAFANARAAMFAQGMIDMVHLAEARGGQARTVIGLAGAGDLYVTCVGGRNGRFGQLLGSGATPEQALRSIGSTVEGVANTAVALGLADRYSIELPTARAVDMALHQHLTEEDGMEQIRRLFTTTMSPGGPQSDHVPGATR